MDFAAEVVMKTDGECTTAADAKITAQKVLEAKVDFIIIVGGDKTAEDLYRKLASAGW